MKTITTTSAFTALTEDEIFEAFDTLETNPETDHPVIVEIERLVGAYSDRFEALCANNHELIEEILRYEPEHTIEQVAYEIFSEALYDSLLDADDEDAE